MKTTSRFTFNTKGITILALLTAFCVVGRFLTEVIPNVQPITAVVLFLAIYVGFVPALIVSSLSLLITSFYLGFGIWVPFQILNFAILIALASLLSRFTKFRQVWSLQIVYAFLAGIIYGPMISIMLQPFFKTANLAAFIVAGLPFDFLHGLSTAIFLLILTHPLKLILKRFNPSESLYSKES